MSSASEKKSNASRTEYYELLGVETDVSEQDLKRAYRKQSLKLHPDRGGDAEEFKRMKYAYDVLLDPQKRKLYDRYGKAAVQAMEGKVSPELFMSIILNIGAWDRFLLIIGLTVITGYLLLFPVLLSVRWDHPNSMAFAHVFIPVWIALAGALCCILCVVKAPEPDPDEENEEMRTKAEEMQKQAKTVKIVGTLGILILFVLLVFLVLRMDGDVNWSYFTVIWPWLVLEVGIGAFKLHTAGTAFGMLYPERAAEIESGSDSKWSRMDWNCFVLPLILPQFVHFITACLIAYKMDGHHMSWWLVFSVILFVGIIEPLTNLTDCVRVKSEDELEGMSDMERMKEPTAGTIAARFFMQVFWVVLVILVCVKLEHRHAFPAYVVFLPLFITGCCFCCCVSCCVCFMHEPDERDGAGAGVAQAQAPAYGSTGTI